MIDVYLERGSKRTFAGAMRRLTESGAPAIAAAYHRMRESAVPAVGAEPVRGAGDFWKLRARRSGLDIVKKNRRWSNG